MLKNKYVVVTLLFLGFMTMGCTLLVPSQGSTPAPRHPWVTRWLENPACSPPCWEGITPGKSTITETLSILNNLPGVSKIEDTHGILAGVAYRWYFDHEGGDGMIVEDEQELVVKVRLNIAYQQFMTLGEVIAAYGFPSHVQRGSRHMNESGYNEYNQTLPLPADPVHSVTALAAGIFPPRAWPMPTSPLIPMP